MDDPKKQQKITTKKAQMMHVTFSGNLGRHLMTPRGLKSKMLDKFVGV